MPKSIKVRRKRPAASAPAQDARSSRRRTARPPQEAELTKHDAPDFKQARKVLEELERARSAEKFVETLRDVSASSQTLVRGSTRHHWYALALAYQAQRDWLKRSPAKRARILTRLPRTKGRIEKDGFAAFAQLLIDYGPKDGAARVKISRDVAALRLADSLGVPPDGFEAFLRREKGLENCAKRWRSERRASKLEASRTSASTRRLWNPDSPLDRSLRNGELRIKVGKNSLKRLMSGRYSMAIVKSQPETRSAVLFAARELLGRKRRPTVEALAAARYILETSRPKKARTAPSTASSLGVADG